MVGTYCSAIYLDVNWHIHNLTNCHIDTNQWRTKTVSFSIFPVFFLTSTLPALLPLYLSRPFYRPRANAVFSVSAFTWSFSWARNKPVSSYATAAGRCTRRSLYDEIRERSARFVFFFFRKLFRFFSGVVFNCLTKLSGDGKFCGVFEEKPQRLWRTNVVQVVYEKKKQPHLGGF